MRTWIVSLGACALILFGQPIDRALAVVTSTWTVQSYKQWDEGEADGAFITSTGELKPGWQSKRVPMEEVDGVWAGLRAPDGSFLLGTDDKGTIYKVQSDKVSKLASIDSAVAVVSLALGKDGALYAGTMPGGEVWHVDIKSGKAKKLAQLDGAETVWALAMAGDTLYAGTGPDGKLFSVDVKSGKATVVFETEDKRITALASDQDGALWLGTSDKALVFRHDPKRGVTRAMADFSGNEITAITAAKGSVIVAANDFDEPTTTGVKTPAAAAKGKKEKKEGQKPDLPGKDSKPGADGPPPAGTEPERKHARKGKGALYRVHGDGALDQLHALTATYFTAAVVTETGAVLAGAGDKGRIYLIDVDDSVSTAFDVEERMVSVMAYDRDAGLVFATSDASAVYRTTGKATKASYVSDVFDAKVSSRYGKFVWHGQGTVKIETRTGNTAKPDKGWSKFQAPRDVSRGGGNASSGKVASPAGRYFQFRVTFAGGDDALVDATRLYYLPQNRGTRVTTIKIDPGGKSAGATLKDGAAKPRSPVLKLDWSVDNPDGDDTRYRLEVRREGEALWRPIVPDKKSLTTTKYEWNTESFPDGYYRLRITAIDDQSNSFDRARETQKISGLFLVDNEKPRIDGINVDYPMASARAVDAMSAIAEMAYSVDDGRWHVGTTSDGLFDEMTEMLRIRLPKDLAPGIHTLAIRVADEAGNIGSASVTFRVK
jgi:hypothetical protein